MVSKKATNQSYPTAQVAPIMFTDIVGYGALKQKNEPLALERLDQHTHPRKTAFTRFSSLKKANSYIFILYFFGMSLISFEAL